MGRRLVGLSEKMHTTDLYRAVLKHQHLSSAPFRPLSPLENTAATGGKKISLEFPSTSFLPRGKTPGSNPQTGKSRSCLCAPTSHPGSFRCSVHRNRGGCRERHILAIKADQPPKVSCTPSHHCSTISQTARSTTANPIARLPQQESGLNKAVQTSSPNCRWPPLISRRCIKREASRLRRVTMASDVKEENL
eukprot:Gb_11274 [translate_table: standard]